MDSWRSKGQRVKLGCCGRGASLGAVELPLLDHMHRLDACNEAARAAKGLEPEHGSHDALDRPVVLLDDVVEVLRLAQFDVCAGVGTNALDRRRVRAAFVDGALLCFSGTPCRSIARYRYFHSPATLMYG